MAVYGPAMKLPSLIPSKYAVLFPLLHDIGSCMSVETPCYTLVALLFFYTGFFTSFVLHIHTIDSFFTIILSSSDICPLSFVFNMFGVLKPPKHCAATSPSRTSKKGRSAPQLIFLLRTPRMGRPPLMPPSPLSQTRRLLQSPLLSKSPPLVCVLDDVYLIYEIYLIPESSTNCHQRMFHLIIVPSTRSDQQNVRVSTPSMRGMY